MGDPELVTRQLGLSSAAANRALVPAIRNLVDSANLLRKHAFGLIAAYYSEASNNPHAIFPANVDFNDRIFQLLTEDKPCPEDPRLPVVAQRYREEILAAENVVLDRSGSLGKICQSFRANILTALNNYYNQPYSLQKFYITAKYDLSPKEAREMCARLGRSRQEVIDTARTALAKALCAAEHSALETLSRDGTSVVALRNYNKALEDKAKSKLYTDDDTRLWAAFDTKYPLPKLKEGVSARNIWSTEQELLPVGESFAELFASYGRMATYCRNAKESGKACRQFAMSPSAGFGADFVPLDKATLLMALKEMRDGRHGASPQLMAYLRTSLLPDDTWGIYVLFNQHKLSAIHTSKHSIDGQILTDGVRVIFPMRTPEASAKKAAAGAASGAARTMESVSATVEQYCSEEEAVLWAAGKAYMAKDYMAAKKRKLLTVEFAAVKSDVKDIQDGAMSAKRRALAVAAQTAAAETRAAKKRERDAMTGAQRKAEQEAKVAAKKAKRDDPYVHIQPLPNGHFVTGVDVGHVFPIYAYRQRVDAPAGERGEFYSVSLGQWYTWTGQRSRARQLQKKVKRANLPQLSSLALVGEPLWAALAERSRHGGRYYAVYGSIAMRRAAFDCYIKKQKTLTTIERKLLPDKKTVLAWGDGDFAHTRRGLATAVNGTVEKYLKQRHSASMLSTPEHRTSMLCSCCHSKMENLVQGYVKRRNGQLFHTKRSPTGTLIPRKIHGLYQCSKEGCYTRWNRDKNAAINIRNVFLSICRTRLPPLHFQRGFKME